MNIQFSVIIPVYNKEKQIENTLRSVLNQTIEEFEVIIIDDGSTDGSIGVVSKIQDKRIKILNKKNEGVSTARNLGIQSATCKFIALLDADDIWYPKHLANLKSLIDSFPNCGIYCTAYETMYYDNKLVKSKYSNISNDFFGIVPNYFENSVVDGLALTSAVAIPRAIFEKHGYFNAKMKSGQDTELWIRIALKEKVAFTSEISARRMVSDFDNHLSFSDKRIDRLEVTEQFKDFEKTDKFLKKYIDINRYAIALERKMSGDIEKFRIVKRDISLANLNLKQKFALILPGFLLNLLKKFQIYLIKNKIYLTTFR